MCMYMQHPPNAYSRLHGQRHTRTHLLDPIWLLHPISGVAGGLRGGLLQACRQPGGVAGQQLQRQPHKPVCQGLQEGSLVQRPADHMAESVSFTKNCPQRVPDNIRRKTGRLKMLRNSRAWTERWPKHIQKCQQAVGMHAVRCQYLPSWLHQTSLVQWADETLQAVL